MTSARAAAGAGSSVGAGRRPTGGPRPTGGSQPTGGPAFRPDWEAVRARASSALVDRLADDFARGLQDLRIPAPADPSEWTHHYFCDDGERLRFDPASPHAHACPRCGRVATGPLVDGAWRTWMHNLAASQAQRAALLLRLDVDPALQETAHAELTRLLAHYSTHYLEHAVHGDKVGLGRVMPQNLDEAIWAIALLRAVRWTDDLLPAPAHAQARTLAGQVAALLEPQVGMIHNIHCWLLAALAECAVATDDAALLERVRTGPFGVEQQIREGFRAEGIWYETSAFYHFYTLSALLSHREAAGPESLSDEGTAMLARAVSVPVQLAYSDGRLPAYGDCWPQGHLADFSSPALAAAALLPNGSVDPAPYLTGTTGTTGEHPIELWIGARWEVPGALPMPGRESIAALVFGSPAATGAALPSNALSAPSSDAATASAGPRESFLWPDAGIGALVSDRVRVTMRSGRDVGMHDHRDKLAVDVEIPGRWMSLDLGSGGYGAAFTTWMRSPAAHSIGVIHDERQPPVDAELEHWDPRRMQGAVRWSADGGSRTNSGSDPGTGPECSTGSRSIRRTITIEDDGWSDVMELEAEEPGPLTWLFHGDGEIIDMLAMADGGTSADTSTHTSTNISTALVGLPGAEALEDLHQAVVGPDGTARLRWDADGSPKLSLTAPPGAEVLTALAPGNPTGRPLGVVIVREHARRTRVEARFRVG
ncbi:hypothetical protein ACXET9_15120 [Brachybacterium sp. DNPG3]